MASPYTFISYARADGEFVLRLATELRDKGVNLWLDQLDIKVGHVWDRAVEEALEGCETFLIVLSPAAISSKNVMDELSFALEEDKKIVPLLHQDCKVPFRVRRLQRADFTLSYDNGMKLLLEVLDVEEVIIEVHHPPAPVSKMLAQPKPGPKKPVQKAEVKKRYDFIESLPGGVNLEMMVIPGYSFWVSKYCITQEQWEAVMGNSTMKFEDRPEFSREMFCKRLSMLTAKIYRLPTPAESTYARHYSLILKMEDLFKKGDDAFGFRVVVRPPS